MILSISLFVETSTVNKYFMVNLVHVPPICVETSHKPGLEKRSVKKVIKSILGGVIKGLFFLHLWGEDRALRLGTVPTGS
ncbi:hypothetical protein FD754_024969 [Muntiacus muntjak]|uniref:Uncharacterized protein n=1 Tax=Muntiacus muntjak TaxID=9888 RepID=A0A5N3UMB5_MUNMU|nr:hypothetical protein FD754_024975 [Muntiacus muntjak]KAB0337815.1 hypothetical protein FD754_024974 [Muntiacus muntjak]KAB0337817.1 hypothetical protein FD754_024972 [Muntiacus muntjak]KAB0337818.1 hypothetical protein FD754_024969 [Muntiacus muntjak]